VLLKATLVYAPMVQNPSADAPKVQALVPFAFGDAHETTYKKTYIKLAEKLI